MTYSTLIEQEGINSQYLIVIKPARNVTSWTLESTNVYRASFDYGYVSNISKNGVAQTLHTSKSLTSGKYYYDYSTDFIYVYSTNISSDFFTVEYELYLSTKDCHWYRDPLDTTSFEVYYNPYIIKEPRFKQTLSDSIIGYMPTQKSSLQLNNAEHWAEYHFYDSSLSNKDCLIYHWIGDLDVSNISLIAKTKMSNLKYSFDQVSINVSDNNDIFSKEWRNPDVDFFNTTTFPLLDPRDEGRPVRYVYGMAEGVTLTNISYKKDDPTTSDNRTWAVRSDGGNICGFTGTCGGGTHTATKTYLTSVSGLTLGDRCKFDRVSGIDEYKEITGISYASNYIEHSTLSGGAMANGDSVNRGTIGYIDIEQSGATFKLYYGRDWTESTSNGLLTVVFPSGLEAGLGMATLKATEKITARVYGKKNNVTKNSIAFGTNSSKYGNLTNPAVILFEILKTRLGLAEADIELADFDTLSSDIGAREIGFAIPFGDDKKFPKFKDIIVKIIQSTLIKLYYNFNKNWTAEALKVLGTSDFDIEKDEILSGSISYDIDYSDILSDIVIEYRIPDNGESQKETASSTTAKYLHGVSKSDNFETVLLNDTDALNLAQKYAAIFGDRKGLMTISSKNRFFASNISDIINVTLEKLMGFSYTEGMENSKKFYVLEIDKGLRSVNITLDDNKGLEDNSALF